MALRKVKPGERSKGFPAEAYNSLVDLIATSREGARQARARFEDGTWERLIITAKTVVTADQKWTYTVKILHEDLDSTAWGGGTPGGDTWDARNTWEDSGRISALGGYENAATGLYPIPIGAVVFGRLTQTSTKTFWVFSERNEPICT